MWLLENFIHIRGLYSWLTLYFYWTVPTPCSWNTPLFAMAEPHSWPWLVLLLTVAKRKGCTMPHKAIGEA